MSTTAQDKEIIEGLARNDKTAIQTIYREHYTMLQSFVLNNNGSADDARDIFQEIMIVLYEKAGSGSFELNCQLKTFIYSIGKRLWLKKLQQLQRFSSAPVESLQETVPVDEEMELHEQKNRQFNYMESAMLKIGEPCKSLLEAYYIQKKPMQDIASEFGYTNADNAKTQKYKCLVRLKKLFFAQYKNGG